MAPEALGLALAAACVHAGWNVLLARAPDAEAATAAALPVGLLLFAPFAVAWWRVEAAAVPFVIASSVLELAYFGLLAAAYRRAELSVVYPLTRGLAPVLVLVVAVTFLGTGASDGEVVGIVLVAGGIVLVRGSRGRWSSAEGALTVAIACCIAGYTLVDRYGVRHANPLAYVELVLVGPALVYPVVVRLRGLPVTVRPGRPRAAVAAVAAGAGMVGSYGLVLAALQRASAASVAAVRESSIVIAVALAAVVLREPIGPRRLAGAVAVAAGVVVIALS